MSDKQNMNQSAVIAGAGFVLSALAAAVPQAAFSQSSALEEVIVTAERRAQDAQDVPIALTIIGGSEISPAGISSISDVALKTPNLTYTQFNIGEPQLFLRGLGTTIDSAGADPTVSVFIDDVRPFQVQLFCLQARQAKRPRLQGSRQAYLLQSAGHIPDGCQASSSIQATHHRHISGTQCHRQCGQMCCGKPRQTFVAHPQDHQR